MSTSDHEDYYEYFSSPLHYAIRYDCSLEMIESIIDSDVDVNAPNYFGETPLHYAIYRNDARIVQLLLYKGSDPYARHYMGETALELARNYENVWKVMRLYSNGVRRWQKLRTYFLARSAFLKLYEETLDRIWSPDGAGYHIAKIQFEQALMAQRAF